MLFTILLIFALALGAFGLLFLILVRRARRGAFDPLDWLDNFSAACYRPMERLLDNGDYAFLACQAGYKSIIARRLRWERIRIFHSYLGGMIRDFHRLLGIARFTAVYASQDQTDLAGVLWRLRWTFYGSVVAIECRVALSVLGLGAVDARGLLASFERMQSYTQCLIPPPWAPAEI